MKAGARAIERGVVEKFYLLEVRLRSGEPSVGAVERCALDRRGILWSFVTWRAGRRAGHATRASSARYGTPLTESAVSRPEAVGRAGETGLLLLGVPKTGCRGKPVEPGASFRQGLAVQVGDLRKLASSNLQALASPA